MTLHVHIERLVVDIGQEVPTPTLESQLTAAISEQLTRQMPLLQAWPPQGCQHLPLLRGDMASGPKDLAQRIGQSLSDSMFGQRGSTSRQARP